MASNIENVFRLYGIYIIMGIVLLGAIILISGMGTFSAIPSADHVSSLDKGSAGTGEASSPSISSNKPTKTRPSGSSSSSSGSSSSSSGGSDTGGSSTATSGLSNAGAISYTTMAIVNSSYPVQKATCNDSTPSSISTTCTSQLNVSGDSKTFILNLSKNNPAYVNGTWNITLNPTSTVKGVIAIVGYTADGGVSMDWYYLNGTYKPVSGCGTGSNRCNITSLYSTLSGISNISLELIFTTQASASSHKQATIDYFAINLTYYQDTTPPSSITNLRNISAGTTWIYWNWTNPTDPDFSSNIIYIDGVNVINTSDN
ncbi:MAG: hypothetical protein NTY68_01970, partial [Candidatus Micrarchaeota archaeon]|nr:hypothetical protein [Candidatus Micrarchaeota archaeon]